MREPTIRITPHAAEQIRLRGLTIEQVVHVVANPEQITDASHGRYFASSRFEREGRILLLRVLVERLEKQELIVLVVLTAYPTSKLGKYWRGGDR